MQRRTLWGRTISFLLVSFGLILIAYRGLPVGVGPLTPFLGPVISLACAIILLALTRRRLRTEGSSLAEFGLAPARSVASKLALGFVGGSLLVLLLSTTIRLSLPMRWELNASAAAGARLFSLAHHLVTNTCEELGFRGYGFDRLRRLIGLWPAQAAVAGLAAVFHVLCGWTWKVALVHTTAGSLLFALVFVRWRSIPAAIGVHAAWNWTRDLILAFPAGRGSLLTPVQDPVWGNTEWWIAKCILVGGTLAACLGLILWPGKKPALAPAGAAA